MRKRVGERKRGRVHSACFFEDGSIDSRNCITTSQQVYVERDPHPPPRYTDRQTDRQTVVVGGLPTDAFLLIKRWPRRLVKTSPSLSTTSRHTAHRHVHGDREVLIGPTTQTSTSHRVPYLHLGRREVARGGDRWQRSSMSPPCTKGRARCGEMELQWTEVSPPFTARGTHLQLLILLIMPMLSVHWRGCWWWW